MTNKYDKGSAMQISAMIGHVSRIASQSILWNGIFGHLSDYVFGVRNFENIKYMSVIFWFKNLQI